MQFCYFILNPKLAYSRPPPRIIPGAPKRPPIYTFIRLSCIILSYSNIICWRILIKFGNKFKMKQSKILH